MKQPEHNFASQENTKYKGDADNKSGCWRKVIGNTISALHKTSWIPNIVVSIAIGLILPAVGLILKNPRLTIYGAALGLTALIWVVALFLQREVTKTAEIPAPSGDTQFRISERPYVVIETMKLLGPPMAGQPITCRFTWKNTGKTPALKVRAYLTIGFAPSEPTSIGEWVPGAKASKGGSEIGYNIAHDVDITLAQPLDQGQIDSIVSGKMHIYSGGAVVYQDVFGDEHYTTCLGVYVPGANLMVAAETGNEVK